MLVPTESIPQESFEQLLARYKEKDTRLRHDEPLFDLLIPDQMTKVEMVYFKAGFKRFVDSHISKEDEEDKQIKLLIQRLDNLKWQTLDLSTFHLDMDQIKALADFIRTNKTVIRIMFPCALIYDHHLMIIKEAILNNYCLEAQEGLWDSDSKIFNQLKENNSRFMKYVQAIKDLAEEYLHTRIIKKIRENKKMDHVVINYRGFSESQDLQLELFHVLSSNTQVLTLQFNIPFTAVWHLVAYSLKHNQTLWQIEITSSKEVKGSEVMPHSNENLSVILRKNRERNNVRQLRANNPEYTDVKLIHNNETYNALAEILPENNCVAKLNLVKRFTLDTPSALQARLFDAFLRNYSLVDCGEILHSFDAQQQMEIKEHLKANASLNPPSQLIRIAYAVIDTFNSSTDLIPAIQQIVLEFSLPDVYQSNSIDSALSVVDPGSHADDRIYPVERHKRQRAQILKTILTSHAAITKSPSSEESKNTAEKEKIPAPTQSPSSEESKNTAEKEKSLTPTQSPSSEESKSTAEKEKILAPTNKGPIERLEENIRNTLNKITKIYHDLSEIDWTKTEEENATSAAPVPLVFSDPTSHSTVFTQPPSSTMPEERNSLS